jgi:hypothetical protein
MSLIISNKATAKQIAMLNKLEYYGSLDLTVEQAAKLIDELFEQQRMDRVANHEYLLDMEGNSINIY